MTPLMTDYLRRRRNELVSRYIRGDVLDIGCGLGTIIPFLDAGQRYVGIEINQEFVAYLNPRFPQRKFYNCNVDEEPLELGDERFDTVLLVAVIEHLAHPEKALAEIQKYLLPSGSLVITTPPSGDRGSTAWVPGWASSILTLRPSTCGPTITLPCGTW